MIPVDATGCAVHVNVCTNEKPGGKSCCKKVGGQEFFDALKQKVRASGFAATVWVTRTGCLGFCNDVGTTVCIKPKEGPPLWYSEVKMEDFDRIWGEIQAKMTG